MTGEHMAKICYLLAGDVMHNSDVSRRQMRSFILSFDRHHGHSYIRSGVSIHFLPPFFPPLFASASFSSISSRSIP